MMDSPLNKKKSVRPSNNDLTMIRGTAWFSDRDRAFRSALLSHATVREWQTDEALYRYGDVGDGLYCIVKGAVAISVPADDGQVFVAQKVGAGFWVGDLAMLSDGPRLITITATEPVRAVAISRVRILEILRENPQYYTDFYAITLANMRSSLRILANMGVSGTERKVILRLLHLDEGLADPDGWMNLSQDQLAAMVGTSLPTVQRLLRRFSTTGAVELGYGRIRIADRHMLTSLAAT